MVQFPRLNKRIEVDLVNLSVTGLGFLSNLDFEVKDRERVVVEASGSEGLVSQFEGEVKRAVVSGRQDVLRRGLLPRASRRTRTWCASSTATASAGCGCGTSARREFRCWISSGSSARWARAAAGCAARSSARPRGNTRSAAASWLRRCAIAIFAAIAALASQAETMKLPFEQLTPLSKLELRCISDQRELQIPVPERWRVKRAVVHLRYTVSANLVPDSSTLVVKMRNEPIAQARLNPQAPDVKMGVEIPTELLEAGYNPLVIAVSQHAKKDQCENPCTPDLWTNVSLRESYVEMEYDLKPLPKELSAISTHVFDPRLMPEGEVNIVVADMSAPNASLAGIVASGVARRFDYRRVNFTVSRAPKPGVDNVLVGKRAFVQTVAGTRGANLASAIKGGYLKILPMVKADGSADPTHALLLLSGEDDNATRLAAITFSNISFRFPGSDELNAFDFALPSVSQYSGRETIAADATYALKTLNFPTQSWVGLNPGERTITFRLPPDFHIRPNQHAKLLLNFSYGVGLKNDSSFNVSVNGRGVRAVRLDSATGTFIENYELNIPTYVFQPGTQHHLVRRAPEFRRAAVRPAAARRALLHALRELVDQLPADAALRRDAEDRALHALGLPAHALAGRARGLRVAGGQGRAHARRGVEPGGARDAAQRLPALRPHVHARQAHGAGRDPGGGHLRHHRAATCAPPRR